MLSTKRWRKKRKIFIGSFFAISLIMAIIFFHKDILISIPYFNITNVKILGDANIDENKILKALDLKGGVSIFKIDLAKLKEKLLLSEPWIKTVSLARKLPSELVVQIESKETIAIANIDGNLFYLDEEGIPIDKFRTKYNNNFFIVSNTENSFKEVMDLGYQIEQLSQKGVLKKIKLSEIIQEDAEIFKLILENQKTQIYISKDRFNTKLMYLDNILMDMEKRKEKAKIIYAILANFRFVVKGL